ncbi:MAG: hypothetical protein HY746_07915 [Elusimicrobia bacterium]|nr:hypothetical protein [Elusimicrobiota bacterium]
MKKFFFLFIFLLLASGPRLNAAWWLENDYSFGSDSYKRETLTLFHGFSTSAVAGVSASFIRDNFRYKDEVFAFRLPVSYISENFFLSLTPFLYPGADVDAKARGAKLYFMTPLIRRNEEGSYTHLMVSASGASQEAQILENQNLKQKKFDEGSIELQVEKNFYNEFFFLFSGALFRNFDDVRQSSVKNALMDHSEMAFLGSFRSFVEIPKHAVSIDFARNMSEESGSQNSYLYAVFSRIALKEASDISSATIGFRSMVTGKSFLSFAYNWHKQDHAKRKDYYKLLFQVFF